MDPADASTSLKPRGASTAALFQLGRAVWQLCHDLLALFIRKLGPGADFVDCTKTARTNAFLWMDHTDLNAGAVDLISFPDPRLLTHCQIHS